MIPPYNTALDRTGSCLCVSCCCALQAWCCAEQHDSYEENGTPFLLTLFLKQDLCTTKQMHHLASFFVLFWECPWVGSRKRCRDVGTSNDVYVSGNGRRMWAVLTITGRIEVLGEETESQVEMGTEERVRGVRGRALALLSDKSNEKRAEEASGKMSRSSSGCCTLLCGSERWQQRHLSERRSV